MMLHRVVHDQDIGYAPPAKINRVCMAAVLVTLFTAAKNASGRSLNTKLGERIGICVGTLVCLQET